jgi:hypothetical protein
MIRIRGGGSGFTGFGGGESRSDQFRQGRRPGQKVRGKLVRWVSDGMAWILIDGHHLLAQLQSRPPQGSFLTFVIKQLSPEIVLKEIFGGGGGTVPDGLASASAFETARTIFENRFRPLGPTLAKADTASRLPRFIALLAGDPPLFAAYLDTRDCAENINTLLGSNRTDRIVYQPWLTPLCRRQLTKTPHAEATAGQGLAKAVVECEAGPLGLVRVEFLHKGAATGYRVKIQRPSRAHDLKAFLLSRLPLQGAGIECLGVGKLPQSEHGGILAELLFS